MLSRVIPRRSLFNLLFGNREGKKLKTKRFKKRSCGDYWHYFVIFFAINFFLILNTFFNARSATWNKSTSINV